MASGSTIVLPPSSAFNMLANHLSMAGPSHNNHTLQSVKQVVAHSTPIRASNSNYKKSQKSQSSSEAFKRPKVGSRKNSRANQPEKHNHQNGYRNHQSNQEGWSSSSGSTSPTSFSNNNQPYSSPTTSRRRLNSHNKNKGGIGKGLSNQAKFQNQNSRQNNSKTQKERQQYEDANIARKIGSNLRQNQAGSQQSKQNFCLSEKLPSLKIDYNMLKKQQTEDYIRKAISNSSKTNVKNLDNWGQNNSGNTANKNNKTSNSNNIKNSGYNRDHNSSYTCQSDSNSSTTKNNNSVNGNNSDGYQGQTQSKGSYVRVATLHENPNNVNDSYNTSLNAYNSNSNNKVTSNTSKKNNNNNCSFSGQTNQKNRNRNSNSFTKTYNNKPVIENCRFAGYAASPDATTLPQPPKDWLTGSLKQQQMLIQSENRSKTDSYVDINNMSSINNKLGNMSGRIDGHLSDKLSNCISLSENDAHSNNKHGRKYHNKNLFANFKDSELDPSNYNFSSSSQ